MLDRDAFVRPIAHRGLHNAGAGIVENSLAAFDAAMRRGYGIECDIRPAAGSVPVVFHDATLERLTTARGAIESQSAADLKHVAFRQPGQRGIPTLADLLDLVAGRVPLLVEIKSEWGPPDQQFLSQVATLASGYAGPIALMSFDPDVMTACRNLAPGVPRGIVSGRYSGAGWWDGQISRSRTAALANLLESGPVKPDFYAYDVSALPTAVTDYVRRVQGLPLFTWTVRSPKDRAVALNHADAMIFEGFEP